MKKLNYILALPILMLISCSGEKPVENETPAQDSTSTVEQSKFNWPTGKYIYVNGGGMYYEEWSKGDSGMYKGNAFFINEKSNDTLFSIKLKLQRKKEKTTLYYVVKGQENKDLEFMLTKEDANVFVFENPFHDFPSILQYKILGDSAMEITERGFVNNHEKEEARKVRKID